LDTRSLNLIAIAIGLFVFASLVLPILDLSPYVTASLAFALLGAIGLDTFLSDGQVTRALRDRLTGHSPDRRERVLRHEAGHFLLAHLFEIAITGYALDAWESLRQGHPGDGGVRFDLEASFNQQVQAIEAGETRSETSAAATISRRWVDQAAMVLMAGIAAEELFYERAIGGENDRSQLRSMLRGLTFSPQESQQRERWAIVQAKAMLERYRDAYDALVVAMGDRASVADCQQAIAAHPPIDPTNQLETLPD
jgi:hypothetical protein